ncbi:hypothetical protein G7046_g2697 [Stylonectria norvegica]|nr:hypothetical protein G7046_g2697 [Stylonectria norvegica]
MMASLLPLIGDLLPMVMPAATRIIQAKQLEPAYPTVEGPVIQRAAIINKCDKMCASVSGSGVLVVNQGMDMELKRHELSPGDFAFVPAWTEHQIRNESDGDIVWLVMQSGSHPIGADLASWGGSEMAMQK